MRPIERDQHHVAPEGPPPGPDPVLARAASALKASLAVGKLYQSTHRLAEADAVLAAALEGFLLRSRCPEIAEAQALVERLAQCFGL
ncbi:MAG: hypothetical protein WBA40_16745 [Roseiarcus sp.]